MVKNFHEKYPESKTILKVVNDPLRVWKENQSIALSRCYFHINKGHDHILLVNDGKNDYGQGEVTEDIRKGILQYLLWKGHYSLPLKITFIYLKQSSSENSSHKHII